jgi:hypothetical protein
MGAPETREAHPFVTLNGTRWGGMKWEEGVGAHAEDDGVGQGRPWEEGWWREEAGLGRERPPDSRREEVGDMWASHVRSTSKSESKQGRGKFVLV